MRKDEQGHITIRDVRCACADCGAHVLAWEGHTLSGWCSVCGSYDVRALASPRPSGHGLGDQLEHAGGRAA
jgi:Zn finger protein HypA/HybF involved in hydrogenase expression